MQFLPKKEERYLAALRLFLQKSILKHGMTDQSARKLRKIYFAEALLCDQPDPTDLCSFSDTLLGASYLLLLQRGVCLSLRFSLSGVCAVYRRAYAALLILLAKNACDGCDIFIQNTDARMEIEASEVISFHELSALVKKLGGYYLKIYGTGGVRIVLPLIPTAEQPLKDENEWYSITDPFSPVNIYLLSASG